MKLSTYAIIVAFIALIYGIGLLFFPVQFGQNFGATLEGASVVLARLYGTALCSYAILYWMNRNIPESDKSWSGLLWSGVFYNIVIIIVMLMGLMDGIGNSMSWGSIVLNSILTLCSLYFIFRRK